MKTKNDSGIIPKGDRVLVKADSLDEVTEGGIVIPQSAKDRHEIAACYGYVVDMGPDCWKHTIERTYSIGEDGRRRLVEEKIKGFDEPFAEIGDRVAWAPYSGVKNTGADGEEYTILNDVDITCVVSEHVTQTSLEGRKPIREAVHND